MSKKRILRFRIVIIPNIYIPSGQHSFFFCYTPAVCPTGSTSDQHCYTREIILCLNINDFCSHHTVCHEYENEIIGGNGEKVNTNILNGVRANTGEFPYMVALGYQTDKENPSFIKYNCGGTLISVQHVVTAAHCVNNINNFVPVEVRCERLLPVYPCLKILALNRFNDNSPTLKQKR